MDGPSAVCGGGRGGTARLLQPIIAALSESAHWQTIDLKPEPKHIMIVAGGASGARGEADRVLEVTGSLSEVDLARPRV
jgi:hypothetical protein